MEKSFFPRGLRLFNDVQLQCYALKNYPKNKLKFMVQGMKKETSFILMI